MACNSCAKSFSILRPEKGCPGCGFSYCSKCLNNKIFLNKLNSEVKVCIKCLRSANSKAPVPVEPPKAYFERIQASNAPLQDAQTSKQLSQNGNTSTEKEIQERLQKLKGRDLPNVSTEEDIAMRLQKIKGEVPSCSDTELQERLANLKGFPLHVLQSKPSLITSDQRSEQEKADDLMKQYLEEAKINTKYKDEFNTLVSDIELRLANLKQSGPSETTGNVYITPSQDIPDSEDEEEIVKKIIEKAKAESCIESEEISPSTNDELPFCEICNEDAILRCLGCRYLFCKRCFMDHKDDDDGCNKYEPYTPPRGS